MAKIPQDTLKIIRDRMACIRDDVRIIGNCASSEIPGIRDQRRDATITAVEMLETGMDVLEVVRETGLAMGSVKAIAKELGLTQKGRSGPSRTLEIIGLLQQCEGNLAEVARRAGISRQRVHQIADAADKAGIQGVKRRRNRWAADGSRSKKTKKPRKARKS